MIPVIALIGHQNVGKSTLFNCLTHSNDALVADFSGLTRDRKYGCLKIKGYEFICIDTGGINNIEENLYNLRDRIETYVVKQSLLAIEEANIVLFIVDAKIGLMSIDLKIANYLRLKKKLVFLIINKIDNFDKDQAIYDFRSLGFEKIFPIVASNNIGIDNLLNNLILEAVYINNLSNEEIRNTDYCIKLTKNKLKDKKELEYNSNLRNLPIRVAIIGRPNVGKSTLTNRLLGEDRMIVCTTSGTTSDSIYIDIQHDKNKYTFIDTAGIRKRRKITNSIEKSCINKSLQTIKDADVVLLILDAKEGIFDQDLALFRFIFKRIYRPLIFVFNKWDNISQKKKKQIKEIINYRLNFMKFTHIHFISALYGSGINNLFSSIQEVYKNSIRRINTSMLTRIMNAAIKFHKPPLVYGRRIKLKYAHAGGYNPFIVVIHGNQIKYIPSYYKRYLINYFYKSLNIIGYPILLQFKEGYNPYIRNNKELTLNKLKHN